MSSDYTKFQVIRGPSFIAHAGPPSFILRDFDGTEWRTEWHPYCGPTHVHKRTGDPLARQPKEKSRFWKIAVWWKDQGEQVVDGVGIWKEPPIVEQRFERIGPRTLVTAAADYNGDDLVILRHYEGYEQFGPL